MKRRIPEVDAYIAAAPDFARPILKKLRTLFHKGSPRMHESIKWSAPFFECDGIVGSMSAFKQHVSYGFWKAKELKDPHGLLKGVGNTQMAMAKASSVADLPEDEVFVEYVREAVRVNAAAAASPGPKTAKRKPAKELPVPDALLAALKKDKKARATFEAFPPSHRNEYAEWIAEAKQEATRARRVAQALEWLSEGKPRNWKYMKGSG